MAPQIGSAGEAWGQQKEPDAHRLAVCEEGGRWARDAEVWPHCSAQ